MTISLLISINWIDDHVFLNSEYSFNKSYTVVIDSTVYSDTIISTN